MNKLYILLLLPLFGWLAACSDDKDSSLALNGEDFILSFSINGQEGTIDNVNKTVEVYLPEGTDLTALQPVFTLSEGAASNIASGSTVNFTMPVVLKITNGNTYIDYTVTVKCYEALVTSFTLTDTDGNDYEGTIDETMKTIQVYVSSDVNVSNLRVSYELSEYAEASLTSDASYDFTDPVTMTVTNNGAENEYTITVTATDMPMTAFVGTAATVDELTDEEKAAAQWMLANIPRSRYIALQDLIDGTVTLDPEECKAIWWHLDDNSWPSQGWDSREAIKTYYANGGSLFLSRYACKYINDVYQISLDQTEPNQNSINEAATLLTDPFGFTIDDTSHAIFEGLTTVDDEYGNPIVYLEDAGCSTWNCQVEWNLWDYSDAHSLEAWENGTGGKRLAYETSDSNLTAIVEFPARTGSAGKVILIGAGAFEWSTNSDSTNQYATNRTKLATNVINYLVGKDTK